MSPVINVEVRGFQSIEHVKAHLDGFTVLVGRSNRGKSAVVRAIKSALTNSTGTAFVRHNPSECARALRKAKTCRCQASVHIQTEGFDLLWEKGDAVNRYTYNGQVYDKPGQGIPEFLTSSGFSPVRVGGESGLIQVADQFFPIFLLNQSGPAAAEAISDVSRLDRINAATRLVEKDRRETLSEKKVREKDLEGFQERLDSYAGLDGALGKVQAAVDGLALVESQKSKVDQLTGYMLASGALVDRIRAIWQVGSVVVPDAVALEGLASTELTLRRYLVELVKREAACKALHWVEGLEALPLPDSLLEVADRTKRLNVWVEKLRSYRDRFLHLAKVDSIPVQEEGGLKHNLNEMAAYLARYVALTNSVAKLEQELVEVEKEEELVQEEVAAIGVCPTCTQPFHAGHQHA